MGNHEISEEINSVQPTSPKTMMSAGELDTVRAAILYEETTDTVLYEQEADKRLAPTSMTKVLTAILVLEKNPTLDGELTVSEEAVDPLVCSDMEEDHLYAGEVISVLDCMKYMLIPSGNEACTALACYLSGSVDAFVDQMNDKAKELGCMDTQLRDPIGLASGTHYTTCRDMLKICRYAMQFKKFREIVAMNEGVVPASNKRQYGFGYHTTNKIRYPGDKEFYFREWRNDVIGIKTGTTEAAGYCFAGCMEVNGLVYYSVCMFGTDQTLTDSKEYRGDFLATLELYDWARTLNLAVFDAGETLGTVIVNGGTTGSIAVTVPENVRILLDGMTKEQLIDFVNLPESINASVFAGDQIAELAFTDAGGNNRVIPLVAAHTVPSLTLLIVAILSLIGGITLLIIILRRKALLDRRISGQDHSHRQ